MIGSRIRRPPLRHKADTSTVASRAPGGRTVRRLPTSSSNRRPRDRHLTPTIQQSGLVG